MPKKRTPRNKVLDCPVSVRFSRRDYQRLLKLSHESKRHFGLPSVTPAAIIRSAALDKIEDLESNAAKGARIAP